MEEIPYHTLKNTYLGTIKPRNPQQHLVIDTLLDPNSKIKVIKGVYGSGKDYLMLAAALQLIENGKFNKIVFVIKEEMYEDFKNTIGKRVEDKIDVEYVMSNNFAFAGINTSLIFKKWSE